MNAAEATVAIKALLPESTVGMIEKDTGFEVWVKAGHSAVGYSFGTSLDEAFSNLYQLVVKKLSMSDPGDD